MTTTTAQRGAACHPLIDALTERMATSFSPRPQPEFNQGCTGFKSLKITESVPAVQWFQTFNQTLIPNVPPKLVPIVPNVSELTRAALIAVATHARLSSQTS